MPSQPAPNLPVPSGPPDQDPAPKPHAPPMPDPTPDPIPEDDLPRLRSLR